LNSNYLRFPTIVLISLYLRFS